MLTVIVSVDLGSLTKHSRKADLGPTPVKLIAHAQNKANALIQQVIDPVFPMARIEPTGWYSIL